MLIPWRARDTSSLPQGFLTPRLSKIGNYLAKLGIPATAGLGVRYDGLHGTDERIDIATIPPIQSTYHEAVLTLLAQA